MGWGRIFKTLEGILSGGRAPRHKRPRAPAEEHPGPTRNADTEHHLVDPWCGNAVLSGLPVRVERADAELLEEFSPDEGTD